MNLSDTPQQNAVAAGLDRRFYAFVIDRLIAWAVHAVAGVAAWFMSHSALATALTVVGVVVVVSLLWVMMIGLAGISPGKAALGLRVVDRETGGPIGFVRAFVRQLVLGLAGLPVFGLGVGMLAWTAVMDSSGLRRGWHDQVGGSAVVDVRPPRTSTVEAAPAPRRIVNLTAMRLMPVPPTPEPAAPAMPEPAAAPEPVPVSAHLEMPHYPQPGRPHGQPQPGQPQHDPFAMPQPAFAEPGPHQQQPVQQAQPVPPAYQQPAPQAFAPRPPVSPAPEHVAPQPVVPQPLVQQPTVAQPAVPAPHPVVHQPVARQPVSPGSEQGGGHPMLRWRVTFDTGESFEVTGLALVGRKPEPRAGETVAHLVALPSSDMSLSKTHAQFQVAPDGALVVMDRGSTNGSVLIRAGVNRALGPRKPATLRDGDRVRFGDREMSVARA